MTTITTPRLSLTHFVTDDWPFFLRLRQDPQVMRFMGEVLSEEALRSVFVSRCADPGCLYCAINSARRWAILGSASARKIRTKLTSATRCCLRLREKAMPAKRCGRSASMVSPPWGWQAINAWVLGENRGSSRLLEKQGFVRTQVLEKAYHLNGVDYDDWIYRLEREAHPASADAG
ncbi:N-acetyltransferase GCN5 [Klebsiella pneumoniae]|nr:N-acetyltransferase GCN5 [Klebsiella pneumoniae]